MPLSWNLGTLTSWNPLGHSGPVTGLLYLFTLFPNILSPHCPLSELCCCSGRQGAAVVGWRLRGASGEAEGGWPLVYGVFHGGGHLSASQSHVLSVPDERWAQNAKHSFQTAVGTGAHGVCRHKEDPKMVVQNFLLLVLSSIFQIPSFSPVCSSSVFSFTFKIFQTLFLLLSFYCSCFPTLFLPYAFLTVPCFVFQGIPIILFYVGSLIFISSSLFLFYFLPFTLLTILSCTLFVFIFCARSPFLFLSSANFLLRHVCRFLPIRHATPPTSNQPLTSRLLLSHGSPSNLLWVVLWAEALIWVGLWADASSFSALHFRRTLVYGLADVSVPTWCPRLLPMSPLIVFLYVSNDVSKEG